MTDRSFSVAKKMGLFTIPLSVVVLKLLYDCLQNISQIVMAFIVLMLLKQLSSRFVQYFIISYQNQPVLRLDKIKKA